MLYGQFAAQLCPVESGAGVLFAAWGDVFVSRHIVQWVALDQIAAQLTRGLRIGATRMCSASRPSSSMPMESSLQLARPR